MPTWQEDMDHMEFEQLRDRLKYEEDLSTQLAGELAELRNKENAARGILREIAELGAHAGDQQRANAALLRIADEKAILERRITQASARLQWVRAQMARFNQAELSRLGKIRGLFQQLVRQQP